MKGQIRVYRQKIRVSYLGTFVFAFIINLFVKALFDFFIETDATFLENVIQSFFLAVVLSVFFVSANKNISSKK